MITTVAAAVVLLGLAVGLALVLGLVVDVARLRRHPVPASQLALALLLAVSLAAAPLLATRLAERQSGWVDADGNGVLDPFSNGSYDWVDVNAGHLVRAWALIDLPLLALWVYCTRPSRHGSDTVPEPQS